MSFNLDCLTYAVQCKWPQKWFETIAAFDCQSAADWYAKQCKKVNPMFEYRVVTKETA